ncbi:unnamed protein product [Microthlaspi erraticum]|uniref:Uncharacterized protein n=1 Tax=Microthlaspi erraticum TaxID=1685480 RepID=A0A6D2K0D1_9BRAS|nr:unnamed protein product [Microthlaspi erraticum]
MDFIKTSSLRALIERLYREQRPTAQSGWPRNECSALGQSVRPSEVSAKVQTTRPITHHDPGNKPAVGRHNATPRRARPKRASREKASRPRNSRHAERSVRPGRTPASGREISSAKSIRPTSRPTVNPSGPDRSDSATTRLSGRSSRTTVPTPRSTRSPF